MLRRLVPLGQIVGASLQRDLQQSVIEAHKQGPVPAEDLKTPDWSDLAFGEDPELLQVAAMEAFICCGESLQDGAVF